MRHGSNSRRSRGRNNGGNRGRNSKTQTYDSNGPDVRIRGNAYQITEKYLNLARDAASAGDTILAESYYQHAEHYQRLINEFSKNVSERSNNASNDQKGSEQGKDSKKQPVAKKSKKGEKTVDASEAPQPKIEDSGKKEDTKAAPKEDKKKASRVKKRETVDA